MLNADNHIWQCSKTMLLCRRLQQRLSDKKGNVDIQTTRRLVLRRTFKSFEVGCGVHLYTAIQEDSTFMKT